MKNILFFTILLFLTQLSFGDLTSDSEETRSKYEKLITNRFTEDLEKILPKDSFSLNTNVHIVSERPKAKKEKKKKIASPTKRPGFDYDPKSTASKAEKELPEEEFLFPNEDARLKSLELTLFLEKSLDEESKSLAVNLIKRKMKRNFGSKANLQIENFNVIEHSKKRKNETLIDLAKNSFLHFIYLFFLLLGLILFIFFYKGKGKDKSEQNISLQREDSTSKNRQDQLEKPTKEKLLHSLKQAILQCYEKETQYLKNFVSEMSHENLKILSRAMDDSIFSGEILRFSSSITIDDLNEDSFSEHDIQMLIQNLKDYIALHRISLKEPFGFIENIRTDFIYKILKDNEKELALVFSVLSEKKSKELLSLLETNKKAKIISLLSKETFFEDNKSSFSELESKLRKEYERLENESFSYGKNAQDISLYKVLSQDEDVDVTIRKAKESHDLKLEKRYDVFSLTFDEIVNSNDLTALKDILKEFENKQIISFFSYLKKEKKEEVLNSFPPTRKNILTSLENTTELTESEKKDIKQIFMKNYRKKIENT